MKTKLFFLSLVILLFVFPSNAQVGVGNTNPQAQLDISASNTTSPTNQDGILIPRVTNLPADASMTVNQDGMLVFYTGSGESGKGFYYWDDNASDWIFLASGAKNTLDQAYDEGGAGAGRVITANNGAVRINGEDGFLVTGTQGSGDLIDTEVTGAGTKMFFNPNKAAFRVGHVDGTQWNDINIGDYSTAMGNSTIASGDYSTALGFNATAQAYASLVLGRYNVLAGTTNSWVNGDPILVVGNGNNASNRSNAFTVLNNGKTGIGQNNPQSPLHVGIQTSFDLSYANTGQDGIFLRGSGNNSGVNTVGSSIGFGPPHTARTNQRKAAIAAIQTSGVADHVGLAFYIHANNINLSPMQEAMRITHAGVGINNNNPDAYLDVIGSFQFEDGNEALGYVLSSDANGNASWADPTSIFTNTDDQNIQNLAFNSTTNILTVGIENGTSQNVDLSDLDSGGDINQVNAGDGLTGGGTIGNVTLNAVGINGITTNANDFRLGGALIQNTTITNGTNNFVINANNSGTFRLQDNGINKFEMNNVGDAVFGGDLYVRDGTSNATSTILARIIDSNDDGVLDIYQGGAIANRIHGNGTSYFNGGKVAIGQTIADGFLDILAINSGAEPHINLVHNGSGGARINFSNTVTTSNVWTLYGNTNDTAANSRFNLFHSGTGNIMVVTGDGNIGIGDTTPDATLDVNGSFQYTDGNQNNGYVLRTDANGSASWVNPNTLGVVSAINGLTASGNQVRLGGALNQNTTVTTNNFNLEIDLNGTGDFEIDDNGTNKFNFNDSGNLTLGGDITIRDESTSGSLVGFFGDSGDDGLLRVYANGSINHQIFGAGQTYFNAQNLNADFRIESLSNTYAFMVDASDNVVRVGHGAGGLPQQGTSKTVTSPSGTQTFNVNYIANFQAGSGSTVGLGTAEFITDGGNQVLMMDANLIPFNDNDDSLGFSGYRWTSLWATNGTINTSDLSLKKDIKPLDYGLEQLMDIETITYKWKDGKTDDTKIGFSAQNLQQILPEVVRDYDLVKPDEKGSKAVKVKSSVLGVYYSDIIPVTVKAIQELNAKIETLEIKNAELQAKIDRLEAIEARLLALENNTNNRANSVNEIKPTED